MNARALVVSLLSSLTLTSLSTSALAAPAVNDTAFYVGTLKAQGRRLALTTEVQLVQYDDVKKAFLQRSTDSCIGQSNTREEWIETDKVLTAETAAKIVANCEQEGGKLETIEVWAGTYKACAITNEDEQSIETNWIAEVPFGIVKAHSAAKDGSMETTVELDTVTKAQ
jgi:hypothetical protein